MSILLFPPTTTLQNVGGGDLRLGPGISSCWGRSKVESHLLPELHETRRFSTISGLKVRSTACVLASDCARSKRVLAR